MTDVTSASPARAVGLSLYAFLWPIAAACFIGALITDVAYWATAQMMWANFSAWLLAAGLVVGVIAAVAGFVELFTERLLRRQAMAWIYTLVGLVTLAVSVVDNFVHSRDAWTSVVPWGLALSAILVLLVLVMAALGRPVMRRRRVGVLR